MACRRKLPSTRDEQGEMGNLFLEGMTMRIWMWTALAAGLVMWGGGAASAQDTVRLGGPSVQTDVQGDTDTALVHWRGGHRGGYGGYRGYYGGYGGYYGGYGGYRNFYGGYRHAYYPYFYCGYCHHYPPHYYGGFLPFSFGLCRFFYPSLYARGFGFPGDDFF